MTSIDQIQAKVEELNKRFKAAHTKKTALGGQLLAKKEELAALKREIEAAGLDPKRLKERRDELQTELVALVEDFSKKLSTVEEALAVFEKKTS